MPIKLPKGFARRKSSGNVFGDVDGPPEPSFRVIERPGSESRFPDRGSALKTIGNGRLSGTPVEDMDNIFSGNDKSLPKNRGSGGTDNSTNSGGLYDSSSSARLSSSSTLPSSTDAAPDHNDVSRTFHDIPIPPAHSAFSLRSAGRTFSFGRKPVRTSTPQTEPRTWVPQTEARTSTPYTEASSPTGARERAMTASSASTATPPKLLDSDFHLGGGDDGFSNLFESFGKQRSALLQEPSLQGSSGDLYSSKELPPDPPKEGTPLILSTVNLNHSEEVDFPAYHSPPGRDGLADTNCGQPSLVSPKGSSSSPSLTFPKRLPLLKPVPPPTSSYQPVTTSPEPDPEWKSNNALPEDTNSRALEKSVPGNRNDTRPPPPLPQTRREINDEIPLFGNDIKSFAKLATQYEERASNQLPQPKVMTPAQFERYREQQELTRKLSDTSKDDSSDESSDYDEDDEAEKAREAIRQRRRQEAHLSVYRQQMKKVTGAQAPISLNTAQFRPTADRASSNTPNPTNRSSTVGVTTDKSGSGKSSDADAEDEDIPLGILAAHGFPGKNRPPNRLVGSSSIPNLRGSAHSFGTGEPSGSRGSLPVFARNLPKDPYFGAGLVNPSNRESLAMGGGAPALGGSSQSIPPGGLVGVIATEERARAMRRGSPNTQATHDSPIPGIISQPPGAIPRPYTIAGVGGPPGMMLPQQSVSPGEQAQIQVSQQMSQFMQMQMQWMQQMMQVQSVQNGPHNQAPANFLSPMSANATARPTSMFSANSFNNSLGARPVDQRTLSILDPGMSRWNLSISPPIFPDGGPGPGPSPGQGYAPSIAPSERSNVGMASRYRPVSIAPPNPGVIDRSSTFTSSTLKPFNNENRRFSLSSPAQTTERKVAPAGPTTIRPVSRQEQFTATNNQNNIALPDEENDDEGWAQMMKRREKKKATWKMKRTPGLGDLLHMVH